MKSIWTTLSLFVLCTFLASADPEPFLKSAAMPFYPPLARQARVQGVVNLRIVVAQDGTVTIDSASGHPLLRDTTAEYVKTWKFGWQQPCACTVKRDVSFVYKISDSKAESDSPIAIVKWFGSSKVEVETNLPVEAILTN